MRALFSAVALTIAILGAGSAAAQIEPGSRVRISFARMDGAAVGTLLELTADSALIDSGRGGPVRFALQGARIERSRGRSGHALEGALILGLAGGAFGYLAKAAHDVVAASLGAKAGGGAVLPLLFGSGGAAAGALIGALIRTEGWERATIQPTAPAGGGVGVGIAIRTR
jgi:hypothetical protein